VPARGATAVVERGLPAERVQAVWDAIPYERVPFRFGWEEWGRREATRAGESRS
jgi:hypothetical protein